MFIFRNYLDTIHTCSVWIFKGDAGRPCSRSVLFVTFTREQNMQFVTRIMLCSFLPSLLWRSKRGKGL